MNFKDIYKQSLKESNLEQWVETYDILKKEVRSSIVKAHNNGLEKHLIKKALNYFINMYLEDE